MGNHRRFARAIATLALCVTLAATGRAQDATDNVPLSDRSLLLDRIELANWSEFHGKVSEVEMDKRKYWQIELPDGGLITVRKSQVRNVVKPSDAAAEYLSRREALADTVDAHWEMQEWCKENKLHSQREYHLMQIVRLDSDHEPARNLLGYREHGGGWILDDQFYQSQGYIKDKMGNYRLPAGLKIVEAKKASDKSANEWRGRVDSLLREFQRKKDSSILNQFVTITEPAAVKALHEALVEQLKFGPQNVMVQRILIEALGRIESYAAQNALVEVFMLDLDSNLNDGGRYSREIREACIQQLKQEHFDHDAVASSVLPFLRPAPEMPPYRPYLAAWLTGEFGDDSTIPWLIDGLVTVHKHQISAPSGNMSVGQGTGGMGLKMGDKGKVALIEVPNQAALDALRLKCQTPDKGFNKQAWLDWYIDSKDLNVASLARDE